MEEVSKWKPEAQSHQAVSGTGSHPYAELHVSAWTREVLIANHSATHCGGSDSVATLLATLPLHSFFLCAKLGSVRHSANE